MKIFSLLNKDAKILYDTMKELQIPENQLYLHDDESCPCGSGKSYKDCCKGKSDDGPVNSKKPGSGELQGKNQRSTCFTKS